ncbi:hypothetical protein LAD12857_42500 [Lacrimispora amygdalina]|uniref:Uncharacterized protein n=1 Tax=Lacrimispora amygdalina TaxID=253257 RepID=A0ABQ5MBV4_9FIRM
MKNILKKAASIVLAALLAVNGGTPLGGIITSGAETQIYLDISTGDIIIDGSTVTCGSDTITATTNHTVFNISQSVSTETGNTITVKSGSNVSVTIENININAPACAFSVENNASVNLTLKGANKLKSSNYYAGLQVPKTASLIITEESGNNVLEVTGGLFGAGIGGALATGSDSGIITVNGGSITANGGNGGAGIGGAGDGGDGTVIVHGGSITASGLGGAAGIGGGKGNGTDGGDGTVTIYGGSITATSTIRGAGIGGGLGDVGGYSGGESNVTIYGGIINAAGNIGGTGIGGGAGGDVEGIGGIGGKGGDSTVAIYRGIITATGIGGGIGGTGGRGDLGSDGGTGGSSSITIYGGSIAAAGIIGGGMGGNGGIGDLHRGGNGGTSGSSSITINGGNISANGDIGSGMGGMGGVGFSCPNGYNGSVGSITVTINGGSINGTIQGTPKNSNNSDLLQTIVTLTDSSSSPVKDSQIISLVSDPLYDYGIKDVKTDNNGKIYLYLPADTAVTKADTFTNTFAGHAQSGYSDTLTDLRVTGVTPCDSNSLINGDLTIIFNKDMDPEPGSVSLIKSDNTQVTLDKMKGIWKDSKTYLIPYTGLSYGTAYTVNISGFKDAGRVIMMSDSTHILTTEPDPALPSVSPDSLTIPKGSSAELTVSFGQGSKAATMAWIESDDNSVIAIRKLKSATPSQAIAATPSIATPSIATPSVAAPNTASKATPSSAEKATPSQAGTQILKLTSPGSILVTGKDTGDAYLTIIFNDGEQTSTTIPVSVLLPAPAWPSKSILTASGITDTEATLTWTGANDNTEISGYKIYQDGELIGFTDASISSYTVEGLSPSTQYHFQVQAGNDDDVWTIDGPSLVVTTLSSDYSDSDGRDYESHTSDNTAPVNVSAALSSVPAQNGQASTIVSKQIIEELIASAIEKARNQGKAADHIGISLNIRTLAGTTALSVTLPQSVTQRLAQSKVEQLEICSSLFSLTFDRESLAEFTRQVTGDLTLSITPAGRLSGEGGAITGQRPVFHVSLSYIREGKTVFITSLGSGRALLSIPYVPADDEETGCLYAVYVDADSNVTRISDSVYDGSTKSVLFMTDHFSVYGIGYTEPLNRYTDISSHWAKDYIEYAADRGYLKGTTDTKFEPDAPMTLGEWKASLDALSGTDTGSLIAGAGESPDQTVNRQESAVFFLNFTKSLGQILPAAREVTAFRDNIKIDSTCEEAVSIMQQAGIMSGMEDNCFKPKETLTRAQFSAMVYRYACRMLSPSTAQGFSLNDSGQWMFFKEGRAVKGWYPLDAGGNTRYYYFDSCATMATGKWLKINGKWYYFYSDGIMAVNTIIDGYKVNDAGVMEE